MNHMMIDLETLATGPNAAFFCIGWCVFDPEGKDIINEGVIGCHPHPEMDIDFETIQWWMQQSNDAKKVFNDQMGGRFVVDETLDDFRRAYQNNNCTHLWANPSEFDIAILNRVYYLQRETPPWDRRSTRDLKTLVELVGNSYEQLQNVYSKGTKHNPQDDAINQAKMVQHCYRILNPPVTLSTQPRNELGEPK